MKSVKCIITSCSFFIFCIPVFACWSPVYTPGEYYVFYSYEEEDIKDIQSTTHLNIIEWQQYAQNKAAYNDIKDVVYNYSVAQMESILHNPDSLSKNTFINYLKDSEDKDVMKFLIVAKKCEYNRERRNDVWWYPTKADIDFTDLQEIIDESLAYKGTELKIRYMLQAIRAAYTMGEHELCLDIWHKYVKKSPESVIKIMCEDYIGGIYFQRGEYDIAIEHYSKTIDISSSFWWCANRMNTRKSDIDRIKILYKYSPSSPELPIMIQKICREAEVRVNLNVFDEHESENEEIDYWYNKGGYKAYVKDRGRYMELRDFALQVASENRSDNPAMWQYAAAFLTLLDGDAKLASEYIVKAENLKGTLFIKNNIRVLHILSDAMWGKYDKSFEKKILPRLQWLDTMIKKNLTGEIKNFYYDDWEDSIFGNYSKYYYNDMMRKVVLAIMAPRYVKKGEEVKALLLAGMVSERFRTLTGYREYRKENSKSRHNIDFFTDIFCMMDTLQTESVIQYKEKLKKGGKNDFEKFLISKCYKNEDYLNEIIGTKYMRTEQFDKAIDYLSRVDSTYDTTLNTYVYFKYDPFYESYIRGKYKGPYSGYKLDFATKMQDLQTIIKLARNRDIKAEATYRYGLGLLSATKNCWALLCYKRGSNYNFKPDNFEIWGKVLEAKSLKILDEAMELSTDPELKAKCLIAGLWGKGDDRHNYIYDNTGDWVETVNPESIYKKNWTLLDRNYSDTNIYKRLERECDSAGLYADT